MYRWGTQWYPCTRLWTERKRQTTPWVCPPNDLHIFTVYRWGAQWYPCIRPWTERKKQTTPWVCPPSDLHFFTVYRWGAQWYLCTRLWIEKKRQHTPWVWPPNAWTFSTISSGLATASPSWILLRSPAYLLVSVRIQIVRSHWLSLLVCSDEIIIFIFGLLLFFTVYLVTLVCHSFPHREIMNHVSVIEVNPKV